MNYLGIDAHKLTDVAEHLNKLLASFSIYYQKLRNFHWSVNGRSFFDLHNLFEQFYNEAKTQIDDIAERILTIGHKPDGTLQLYLDKTEIQESSDSMFDHKMAIQILQDKSVLIELMRDTMKAASKAEDEGTVDLISGMLSRMEKKAWLLHSWNKRNQIEVS